MTKRIELSAAVFALVLAAAFAYGTLMLTSFRGFSQFGLIGGVGMKYGNVASTPYMRQAMYQM